MDREAVVEILLGRAEVNVGSGGLLYLGKKKW